MGNSPSSEDQGVDIRLNGSVGWVGARWWYRLANVCQRWRNRILGSISYLGCLLGTYGTPVLAYSPSLPLIIDYHEHGTAEDEEAIISALEQRDRVGVSGLYRLF